MSINNMNNLGDSQESGIEDMTSVEDSKVDPNRKRNEKLGSIAKFQALDESSLSEKRERLLRADDEISYELNLAHVKKYLKNVDIDQETSKMLLSSGVFDVPSEDGADYRVSLWNEEDENGEAYLTSSIRNTMGYRRNSGHMYKIFERSGLLVLYDYTYDHALAKVSLFDQKTGKIIAFACSLTGGKVVNNENLDDNLNKFSFKITDEERFDELENEQTGGSHILSDIKDSVAKAMEERKTAEEALKNKEKERDVEDEAKKSGILELIISYVKDRRLIDDFVKRNNGHVWGHESSRGNYLLETDLDSKFLEIPNGMTLETRLYGPAEGERQYDIYNKKNKKIGRLNYWPPSYWK